MSATDSLLNDLASAAEAEPNFTLEVKLLSTAGDWISGTLVSQERWLERMAQTLGKPLEVSPAPADAGRFLHMLDAVIHEYQQPRLALVH